MNKGISLLFAALILVGVASAYIWTACDFNKDNKVNLVDTVFYSQNLGRNDCNSNNSWCNGTDITHNGAVNLEDTTIYAHFYGCPGNTTNGSNSTCWINYP